MPVTKQEAAILRDAALGGYGQALGLEDYHVRVLLAILTFANKPDDFRLSLCAHRAGKGYDHLRQILAELEGMGLLERGYRGTCPDLAPFVEKARAVGVRFPNRGQVPETGDVSPVSGANRGQVPGESEYNSGRYRESSGGTAAEQGALTTTTPSTDTPAEVQRAIEALMRHPTWPVGMQETWEALQLLASKFPSVDPELAVSAFVGGPITEQRLAKGAKRALGTFQSFYASRVRFSDARHPRREKAMAVHHSPAPPPAPASPAPWSPGLLERLRRSPLGQAFGVPS